MKKIFIYFLPTLFAFSCSSGDSKKQETQVIFKYNEMAGITSLDPAAARTLENIWAVNQLYNGLVEMDDHLRIQPGIAKAWEISTDGLTYTFHLNNNVFFHDHELFPEGKGRKVSAIDFVYSFTRLQDPKISSATSLLSYVNPEKGFEATNDSTFVIHLQQAFTPFLGILTMKYFAVVPKEIVEHYKDDFRKNAVGTGPFMLKLWEEGSKLLIVKNPGYFEYEGTERLPYLDAVSVSFIKDKETAFLDFLQGNLDMVSGIDAINTDKLLTAEGVLKEEFKNQFTLYAQPSLKTDYLGILVDEELPNVKTSPLKLKVLRQAINYGIDRKKMVQFLRKNLGIPANAGFVPPGLPSFDATKVKGYDYDPEKVKELLRTAGYPDGKGLSELSLYTTEQYLDIAEYIQAKLLDVGIKIKIEVEKASALTEDIANNKINFFRKSWVADYPDGENFLALFYSKNKSPKGFNYTRFSNAQFDGLYEKSQKELNDSVRYSYYQLMDQIILDEAPIVPLYYDEVVRLVHNNVSGLGSNSMNMLTLKKVRKK